MDTEIGRYVLLDVPGMTDDELKRVLGNLIKYPQGILQVNWEKPAISKDIGGVVALKLDKKAADLLKSCPEKLLIRNKQVTFVDRKDLSIKAVSTIDDDIVELVKEELSASNKEEAWQSLVGSSVTLSKCLNDKERYDYWRIEGTFAEIKKFEDRVGRILFKDQTDSPPSSESKKKNPGKSYYPDSSARSEDGTSKDSEADISSIVQQMVEDSIIILETKTTPPLRIEFVVGDLSKEFGVDAIVNASNYRLNANANKISHSICTAMGESTYEKLRFAAFSKYKGDLGVTTAVATEAGGLGVKKIIHVAIPGYCDVTTTSMNQIAVCYENCFGVAANQRMTSIAFPPLGFESGFTIDVASGAAISAVMQSMDKSNNVKLYDYLNLIRFVFVDHRSMNCFVEIFEMHFDSFNEIEIEKPVRSDKGNSSKTGEIADQCKICMDDLENWKEIVELSCRHKYHMWCIQQWLTQKKNCPECFAKGNEVPLPEEDEQLLGLY